MTKTLVEKKTGSKFRLAVTAGSFRDSEIVVMLGENGVCVCVCARARAREF
jgi:translation initiation factor RLI1